MEEERARRYQPKVRKRRRLKYKNIFLLLMIIVFAFAGYAIYQFKSGQKLAESSGTAIQASEDFIGDELNGERLNVLLLGIDSREGEQARSDSMMVVSWNQQTNDVKVVSLMRDIYADIPGYKQYKLNTAYYLGGAQLAKETISTMFDLPIHHYAVVDFQNFESLIDILAPNGVEIDVEKDMSELIDVSLTKGVQQLNGKELLGYARFRHDAEGDFGRVRRQQQVIGALKDQMFSLSTATQLPKFVGALDSYVATDMTSAKQLQYVLKAAVGGGVETASLTIPVEGEYTFKSYSHAGSVIVIDQEANNAALQEFLEMP